MLDVDAPLIVASRTPCIVGGIERRHFTFCIDERQFRFSGVQPMYIVREVTAQEFADAWIAHGASRSGVVPDPAEHWYFYEVHTD